MVPTRANKARRSTVSARPSTEICGTVQATPSNGNAEYVGPVDAAGSYTLVSGAAQALHVYLPSASPSGLFNISTSTAGLYFGVSVASGSVLSNGPVLGSRRKFARSYRYSKRDEGLTALQNAIIASETAASGVTTATLASAAAAGFALASSIAEGVVNASAAATYAAAYAISGPNLLPPAIAAEKVASTAALAAAHTLANAAASAAYIACVVAASIVTTAATAQTAVFQPNAPTSVAAAAAALAVSVAATAAAGGDPVCGPKTAKIANAITAAEAEALAVIAKEAIVTAIQTAADAAALVVTLTTSATGSPSAHFVATTDEATASVIWSISPSYILSAVYPNLDGTTVARTIFFAYGKEIGITGNLAAYNTATGASATPLTFTFIPGC